MKRKAEATPLLFRTIGALCAAALLTSATSPGAERTVLETVMARVNERIITITDFQQRLRQELSQIPAPPTDEELRRFAENLFQSVVDEMIILERAEEKRLTVDEDQVDAAIQSLREENNLLEDDAFKQALEGAGLTVESLRQRYGHNMLLQRTVQSEIKPTEITEEEVRQVYEQEKERFSVPPKVDLEQMFFAVADDESDRENVLRRARGMTARVRKGADLAAEATLAGVELQDLGAIPEADLRPDLKTALDGLGDSGLTEPIQVNGGFQVVNLLRRIPAGYQPFDEVKEQLRRRLSQASYQDQTQGLVAKLTKEYLVEIHREYLDMVLERLPDV